MSDSPTNDIDAVDFYWRQGCGFCMALDRRLTKAGIAMNKKNIWEDGAHAAFVRSVADGNEVVPTVVVGTTAMVNPSLGQVIAALRNEAPHLVPEGADDAGPVSKVASKIFGRD